MKSKKLWLGIGAVVLIVLCMGVRQKFCEGLE